MRARYLGALGCRAKTLDPGVKRRKRLPLNIYITGFVVTTNRTLSVTPCVHHVHYARRANAVLTLHALRKIDITIGSLGQVDFLYTNDSRLHITDWTLEVCLFVCYINRGLPRNTHFAPETYHAHTHTHMDWIISLMVEKVWCSTRPVEKQSGLT